MSTERRLQQGGTEALCSYFVGGVVYSGVTFVDSGVSSFIASWFFVSLTVHFICVYVLVYS